MTGMSKASWLLLLLLLMMFLLLLMMFLFSKMLLLLLMMVMVVMVLGGSGLHLRSPSLLRGQIIPTARRAGRPKDVFLTLLAHGKKVDQRQTKVASKGNTFFLDGKNTFLQLVEFASFIHMKSIALSCCAARLWKSRPLDTLGYWVCLLLF